MMKDVVKEEGRLKRCYPGPHPRACEVNEMFSSSVFGGARTMVGARQVCTDTLTGH